MGNTSQSTNSVKEAKSDDTKIKVVDKHLGYAYALFASIYISP